MTDPLIIDAVENSFVPLLIHNNRKGKDTEVLKKYKEPAWNYQVIRFLTKDGKNIIPRHDKINTKLALSSRMIQALETAKQPVPATLRLTQLATDTRNLETAAFSCHCFWTGETKLGALEGVVATEAGWVGGREVTLVTYHKKNLPLRKLIQQARKLRVANHIYLRTAKKSDQKRQIPGTPFAKLKLTPAQACKVNAHCRTHPEKARAYLTASQRQSLKK